MNKICDNKIERIISFESIDKKIVFIDTYNFISNQINEISTEEQEYKK